MEYLFRQHYNLQPLPDAIAPDSASPIVLLAESEPEALALYARHLARADLQVNVCMELALLLRQVQDSRPGLLIINPTPDITAAIALLRQIAAAQPGIPVITIGAAIPDAYLDQLMASGVALHLNRSLTRPQDIAVAARQLLGLT
jgi:DNA-binding NtrC family response regulator